MRDCRDDEGRPGRRPLSYDEVQKLFDAADDLSSAPGVVRCWSLPSSWSGGGPWRAHRNRLDRHVYRRSPLEDEGLVVTR